MPLSLFQKGHIPWNKIAIKRNCLQCGQTVELKPSRGIRFKFCSKQCQYNSMKNHNPWNKRKELTLEHKEKLRLAKLGKKQSPEHIEKRRLGMLGHFVSEETKTKLRLANTGKKHSEEAKRKIGLISKGRKPWNKGRKEIRLEVLKKISESHKGKIPWNNGVKGLQIAWNKGIKITGLLKEKMYKTNRVEMTCSAPDCQSKYKVRRTRYEKNQGHFCSVKCRAKILPPASVFKNTSIELRVQNLLKENKIDFETHYSVLGHPDIFIKPNICIFVDGCYWHKCSECGFEESIRKEKEKDKRITQELQKQGYLVIRIWEHEIKNNQFGGLNQLLN